MGRHARRREALAELAMERFGDALEAVSPDARLTRERFREERRQRRAAESRRQLVGVGVGLLVGGLASGPLGAVAAVGLGFIGAAGAIYLMRTWQERAAGLFGRANAPRRPDLHPPNVAPGLPDARRDLVRNLLEAATRELRRLEAAAGRLGESASGAIARRLVESGARLVTAVAATPDKLPIAQRALTYHFGKAALLAETLAVLEADGRDAARIADTRVTLARLEVLFEKTELDLIAGDVRQMDLELRLVNQALDEDLGGERRPG